jgi:hypothetical protein
MSLNINAPTQRRTERTGIFSESPEALATREFVNIFRDKGSSAALAYYTSLEPSGLKDYVRHSSVSCGIYDRARQELEGGV